MSDQICRFCGAVCSPGERCHHCGDYDSAKHMAHLEQQLEVPPELNAMARKVLSYKPRPKSKPAKARKRRAAKIAKGSPT